MEGGPIKYMLENQLRETSTLSIFRYVRREGGGSCPFIFPKGKQRNVVNVRIQNLRYNINQSMYNHQDEAYYYLDKQNFTNFGLKNKGINYALYNNMQKARYSKDIW